MKHLFRTLILSVFLILISYTSTAQALRVVPTKNHFFSAFRQKNNFACKIYASADIAAIGERTNGIYVEAQGLTTIL